MQVRDSHRYILVRAVASFFLHALVGCSEKKKPVPERGINHAVRVCNLCYEQKDKGAKPVKEGMDRHNEFVLGMS